MFNSYRSEQNGARSWSIDREANKRNSGIIRRESSFAVWVGMSTGRAHVIKSVSGAYSGKEVLVTVSFQSNAASHKFTVITTNGIIVYCGQKRIRPIRQAWRITAEL